ncbi:MAG: sigma-70 family RNA polymerase sigma factor [Acidobacteriota bacterium]|nr:sigma-70 family RNA polymerase sigma factor [Acidobacteriota bacterium]
MSRVRQQYRLSLEERSELLQEVRIALWQHGLEVPVGFAWVARVTVNKAVDLVRRRTRQRAHDELLAYVQDRSPGDQELAYLLQARVEQLPPRLRAFYELHYQEGLSERDIAQRLGTCRASVRWLDHQCRKQILG